VPIALAGNSELASQFDEFAKRILDPSGNASEDSPKRGPLGLQRLASMW
jgi:hypothetical protein